ncbi:MAG: prepilin-type N-terminal cleavage/methylation domain-containing protein [Candidatus Berkiella sp.]
MNRQRGFTFVEMILALLICAILAGIIIEIIAGPIKSYFWLNQRALLAQEAELALDMMEKEFTQALAQSIDARNAADKQSISFRKIIAKTFVEQEKEGTNLLRILTNVDKVIEIDKPYLLKFQSDKQNKLYQVTFSRNQDALWANLDEKISLQAHHPIEVNILSALITYRCENHELIREQDQAQSLLNNQIKSCQFAQLNESDASVVFLNLQIQSLAKEPMLMTRPVTLQVGV